MRLRILAALLFVPALASAQTTVYSKNFENNVLGAEWSGAGSIQTTGGLSAFGFGALHLRNEGALATNLAVSGLATHSTMTVRFSLALWDGINFVDDIFQFYVGNVPLFDGKFGNYNTFATNTQCEGPGTQLTPSFTNFTTPNYGYFNNYRDCARDVSFSFAHSASNETFSWIYPNSRAEPNQSFGIDNVIISTNASQSVVPEPSTYALMAAGLGMLALVRRRRRSI